MRALSRMLLCVLAAFCGTLLTACDSTAARDAYPQIPSYAISQKEKTRLGDSLAATVRKHPGKSGFSVLTTGSDSFSMRMALIQEAEKTLDLQYYSMHDDTTANLLLEAVVRAAQRGVRIRFLIDNIGVDEVEETLAVLDGFRNVEIRVFNPLVTRDHGLISRITRVFTDLDDYNRRMHNKALISDNQLAIIGGRNLGDEYFEENTDVTFRDIDLLTAGPITARISASFDRFWNSPEAYPIGQLLKPRDYHEDGIRIRRELATHWRKVDATPKGHKLLETNLSQRLKNRELELIWARGDLAVDEPQKINKEASASHSKPMMRLDSLLERAEHDFLAVSPYFVPRKEGVEWLAGMMDRGLKIRVLTNSLASTDVVAVHGGYAPYREELLRRGLVLYELKPIGGERPRQRLIGSSAPAHASLHAKIYIIDGREVMIGSFNLDPRSIELNTELAITIHSPQIAQKMTRMFDDVASPENSYELKLENSKLVWITREKGKEVRYSNDPEAGIGRRVQSGLLSLLPLEDHL